MSPVLCDWHLDESHRERKTLNVVRVSFRYSGFFFGWRLARERKVTWVPQFEQNLILKEKTPAAGRLVKVSEADTQKC